jgi:transposase-like protein
MKTVIRSLPQAARMIQAMEHQGFQWTGLPHDKAAKALKEGIESQMRFAVDRHLEELRRADGAPADRRNGYYTRHLLTALGDIELCVPRTRRFNPAVIIRRYARRERCVDRLILSCFVLGISTRKVAEALISVLREPVSPQTVSRVAKTLDGAALAFHRRKLTGRYKVIVLDGVVLSRRTGAGAIKRPVLVALGIRADGKKEIIDFRLASSESEAEWERFLTDLYRRGLEAEGVEFIAVDGGNGLAAALRVVFPNIPVQRCWAHKARNILDKVRKADRELAKRGLRSIYTAKNVVRARAAARRWAERWEQKYPRAVKCLRADLDELLTFFRFKDPAWRKATRTTNSIERRFREVRRRTRPMGVFSDRTSMERILYAVFSHENRQQGTATPFLVTQNS